MLKPTQKLKCRDEKLHITKDVPDKDIELTLELEMDDEVKDIISCPEKYGNTMLDVTVIKPKLDKLYTAQKKIMSGEEVKKFIAAMSSSRPTTTSPTKQVPKDMKLNSDTPRNLSSKPKSPMEKFAPPPMQRNTGNRTDRTEGSTSEMDKEKIKQIYTASRTFAELNSFFECKNKNKRDQNLKPEEPCTCKNCSIIGIVADSQKKPFANETIYVPSRLTNCPKKHSKEDINRKKTASNYKEETHMQCQYYFKHLSEKIRVLEDRIAAQEERSVAKDYFKKIISKVMNHISKVTNYASQIRMEIPCQTKQKRPSSREKYTQVNSKYVVNQQAHQEREKHSSKGEPSTSTGTFWKWGEDILKPGIDIKNKIILLMEDTLNNLKKSKEKPKEEEIKQFVDQFSANLYKTVRQTGGHQKQERVDLHTLINFKDNREKSDKIKNMARRFAEEPVSVTYVNSKILRWKETETTFRFESDKESVNDQKKMQEIYKMEFMKTLKNTREEDKLKLWFSIWNQAIKNSQDKTDKVTIQIPDRRDPKKKHVEIAYTLGDLEYLLLGQKSRNR